MSSMKFENFADVGVLRSGALVVGSQFPTSYKSTHTFDDGSQIDIDIDARLPWIHIVRPNEDAQFVHDSTGLLRPPLGAEIFTVYCTPTFDNLDAYDRMPLHTVRGAFRPSDAEPGDLSVYGYNHSVKFADVEIGYTGRGSRFFGAVARNARGLERAVADTIKCLPSGAHHLEYRAPYRMSSNRRFSWKVGRRDRKVIGAAVAAYVTAEAEAVSRRA